MQEVRRINIFTEDLTCGLSQTRDPFFSLFTVLLTAVLSMHCRAETSVWSETLLVTDLRRVMQSNGAQSSEDFDAVGCECAAAAVVVGMCGYDTHENLMLPWKTTSLAAQRGEGG